MIGVLDTSALVRFYLPDGPMPEGLEAFMGKVDLGEAEAVVPNLIWLELSSVLLKKVNRKEISSPEAEELLEHWRQLPLKTMDLTPQVPEIWRLARQEKLTVYDASFLHLAICFQADLFTADEKLQLAASRKLGGGS